MEKMKKRILDKAEEKFFQFGFTKVTMDEIATELGISKKTIYKYFPGKKMLLKRLVKSFQKDVERNLEEIAENEELDYMERLKTMMHFLGVKLSKIKKPLIRDIQINAPEIWEDINQFRERLLKENLGKILDKGIETGIFRNDFQKEIFMLIYLNLIQSTVTPKVLSQIPYTPVEVFETIIKIFFGGILTEDARKRYFSEESS